MPPPSDKNTDVCYLYLIFSFTVSTGTHNLVYTTNGKKIRSKVAGYTGNFEERKLDINEQFEFVEISIVQVQAEIYILMFGILIATIVLFIEFCLQKISTIDVQLT